MKRSFCLKWLLVAVLACGLAVVVCVSFLKHRPLPLAEIVAVRQGMTMDEVRSLLGNPEIRSGRHEGHSCLWRYNWWTNDWVCKVYFDGEWRVESVGYLHDGKITWTVPLQANNDPEHPEKQQVAR